MPGSLLTPAERARKTSAIVCKALQEPGRAAAVATALGVSESTISRIKNDHLETFAGLLAHLGLKVVPASSTCYPQDRMAAILLLAKERLETVTNIDQLQWDE